MLLVLNVEWVYLLNELMFFFKFSVLISKMVNIDEYNLCKQKIFGVFNKC